MNPWKASQNIILHSICLIKKFDHFSIYVHMSVSVWISVSLIKNPDEL